MFGWSRKDVSVLGSQVFGQASMEGCVWLWWQIVWFCSCGCHCGGLLYMIAIITDTLYAGVLLAHVIAFYGCVEGVVVVSAVVVMMDEMVDF